ncbi:hypothetical protein CFO_g5399 [Ceratocystis platani]|uniref:Uncharacterized protein n=1 Tax=Ceratocystis fimbriata f. sp. platani TaxID=88771 RepID=A0A0F8D806_CERFI|nr:hypothetical protein CFO_g5399 [Ceratocystis platani]
MCDCESFLTAGKLKELNTELGKALKNAQKTRTGFALAAHKNGRDTLQEEIDETKDYTGSGTGVVQAMNTDSYLVGRVEHYLNGEGKTVEVGGNMMRHCFA